MLAIGAEGKGATTSFVTPRPPESFNRAMTFQRIGTGFVESWKTVSLDVSRGKTDGYDRVRGMNRLREEIVGKGKRADRVKHWELSSCAVLRQPHSLRGALLNYLRAILTIVLNRHSIWNVRLNDLELRGCSTIEKKLCFPTFRLWRGTARGFAPYQISCYVAPSHRHG